MNHPYTADLEVKHLLLSTRTTNSLYNNGIETVGKLLDLDEGTIPELKGIGSAGYDEIRMAQKRIQDRLTINEQKEYKVVALASTRDQSKLEVALNNEYTIERCDTSARIVVYVLSKAKQDDTVVV